MKTMILALSGALLTANLLGRTVPDIFHWIVLGFYLLVLTGCLIGTILKRKELQERLVPDMGELVYFALTISGVVVYKGLALGAFYTVALMTVLGYLVIDTGLRSHYVGLETEGNNGSEE